MSIPKRRYCFGEVMFKGSSEGGEEILILTHPSGSAAVITTWGFDYGGGIGDCFSIPKSLYNAFRSINFEGSYEAVKWLHNNCRQYLEKPYE